MLLANSMTLTPVSGSMDLPPTRLRGAIGRARVPSHCPEHKARAQRHPPGRPGRPLVLEPPHPPAARPPLEAAARPLGRPALWPRVRRDPDEAPCLSGGNARCETPPGNAGARPFEPLHPLALLELGGRDRPRQRLVQRLGCLKGQLDGRPRTRRQILVEEIYG